MKKIMISMGIILTLSVGASAFDFKEEMARELGAIAFAATCSNQQLMDWDVGYVSRNYPNFRNIQIFQNHLLGTKGFIGYNVNYGSIVITFRGSENIPNWLEDLDTFKVQFNDECKCQVHLGFKEAYLSLKSKALALFAEYRTKYPFAQIQVIGHSLGGALATLFASELSGQGYPLLLQTMGSPRVGDIKFWEWFETHKITHYRIVHESDNVPHLPPHQLGFTHVNREIWYHEDGFQICQELKGEDKECSYSVQKTTFNDHHYYMGWDSRVDC